MWCRSLGFLAVCCAAFSAARLRAAERASGRQEAFFRAREHRTEYAGPGREDVAPATVDEIRIGYFGPGDPADPEGGDLWCAAQLALDEANAAGGYHGKPFRLVAAWSENPWGTGVAQVARMVYREKVWAIVGGIDGPSTHLAEQVVVKSRLTLLGPASTDKTANLANVPWMFSLLPGDHLGAPVLAGAIESIGKGPLVLVSADDHDSRHFTSELEKGLSLRHLVPQYHFQCRQGMADLDPLVERVLRPGPAAIVIAAGANDSARLVKAVREGGFSGTVLGGPSIARKSFSEQAKAAAEGVVFPLVWDPQDGFGEFEREFRARFDRPPDYAAAQTYDAVRLLVAAIRKAGLNRARIRDAVEQISPWTGVAGTITWDALGANTRAVRLGVIRDGRPVAPP
ncbi:MAG: ABC transporter substrate-binding protein [Pirellulales bacterium]|nr:ABC transporter substrate-binding protein [Pirellulales bacterium]